MWNTDALSRRPCLSDRCRPCDRAESKERAARELDSSVTEKEVPIDKYAVRVCTARASTATAEAAEFDELTNIASMQEIIDAQKGDSNIGLIIQWMMEGNGRPEWTSVSACSEVTKIYWAQWDSLVMKQDILYWKWKSTDGKEAKLQLSAEIVTRRDLDAVTQKSYGWAFWRDKNNATGEVKILLAILPKRCKCGARSVLCVCLRKVQVSDRRRLLRSMS